MSGWTHERVEQLKKLWIMGLSASQIAKELGAVTRNAVIGKIHRLDLVARQSPKMTPPPALSSSFLGMKSKSAGSANPQPVITVTAPAPQPASQYQAPAAAFAALAERTAERTAERNARQGPGAGFGVAPQYNYSALDRLAQKAGGRQCQWPVGDPRSAGFHFCGGPSLEALPYCGEHAKLAYQPAKNRRVNVGADPHSSGSPDEREITVRA